MSSSSASGSIKSPGLKSILKTRRPALSPQIHPLPRNLTDRIPPEIFELIVDYLLLLGLVHFSTCSLVSKVWLNATRHRHLASVVVDRRKLLDFLHILDPPYSTLRTFIRHVSINNNSGSTLNGRVTKDDDLSSAQITNALPVLINQLATFTALTSMRLSWLDAEITDYFLRCVVLTGRFGGLRDLEFSSCSFITLHNFVHGLCALRNLQRLALIDSEWYESGEPDMDGALLTLPPNLQRLEVHVTDLSDFCLWLASHSNDPHMLCSLDLCSVLWEEADCAAIGNLLRRFGRSIQHLSLPWHVPEVDLNHLVCLETLEFTRLRHYPEVLNHWSITGEDIERTLSQFNSPFLHTVIFRVLVPNGVDPYSLIIDWACIAQLLAKPSNDRLEAISLSGLPSDYDRKFAALLRSRAIEREMDFHGLRSGFSLASEKSHHRRSFFDTAQVDELGFAMDSDQDYS